MLAQIQSQYIQALKDMEGEVDIDRKWEQEDYVNMVLQPDLINWFLSKDMEVSNKVAMMIAKFATLNKVHQDKLCLIIARWDIQS